MHLRSATHGGEHHHNKSFPYLLHFLIFPASLFFLFVPWCSEDYGWRLAEHNKTFFALGGNSGVPEHFTTVLSDQVKLITIFRGGLRYIWFPIAWWENLMPHRSDDEILKSKDNTQSCVIFLRIINVWAVSSTDYLTCKCAVRFWKAFLELDVSLMNVLKI